MRRFRTGRTREDNKVVINRNHSQRVSTSPTVQNESTETEKRIPLALLDEKIMETVIISNMDELNQFVRTLDGIEQVGCYLDLTRQLGRFDRCAHIIMNVSDMLVVVTVVAFQSNSKCEEQLWKIIGKHLFSNEKMEKIFFDSAHTADYLYHKHGIRLTNCVDLKVARECLLRKQLACWCNCQGEEMANKKVDRQGDKLVDFWETYIPGQAQFLEYAIMLKDEPRGITVSLTQKKRCALQVKYLLKIYEAMKKEVMDKLEEILDAKLTLGEC